MPVVKLAGAIKKVDVPCHHRGHGHRPPASWPTFCLAKSTAQLIKMEREGKVITFWVKRIK